MNYVCSYWLSPNADKTRATELSRYFDLQCYLKKRMGCRQLIVTNIDYPGSIALRTPPNFTEKYAMFARYFGLRQLLLDDLEFPICLHDHDFFNAKPLPYDPEAILVGSQVDGYFSEQAVVYPEVARRAITDFLEQLWRLDVDPGLQQGYGTDVRHEGCYSTEQTLVNMALRPFASIPIRRAFNIKDQVSFDIVAEHSLDAGSAHCDPIPDGTHGIHGHLNKGAATDALLNWLASELTLESNISQTPAFELL